MTTVVVAVAGCAFAVAGAVSAAWSP